VIAVLEEAKISQKDDKKYKPLKKKKKDRNPVQMLSIVAVVEDM
jgi:hypothetical protein